MSVQGKIVVFDHADQARDYLPLLGGGPRDAVAGRGNGVLAAARSEGDQSGLYHHTITIPTICRQECP